MAEWITLIGFACIGLEIDLSKFLGRGAGQGDKSREILGAYLTVQAIDIITTFGWAFLMFHSYNWEESNEDTPVDPDTRR